jgi:hypothetical protein
MTVDLDDESCQHIPDLHRMLADPGYVGRLPKVTARRLREGLAK